MPNLSKVLFRTVFIFHDIGMWRGEGILGLLLSMMFVVMPIILCAFLLLHARLVVVTPLSRFFAVSLCGKRKEHPFGLGWLTPLASKHL